MIKKFDDSFKTKLNETVQDIENLSVVEVVAIIKAQSNPYKDVSLWGAFLTMAALYTFFMFSPMEFSVYLIYFITILSFPAVFFFIEVFQQIKRPFLHKAETRRKVEIMARAVFQKVGMYHTSTKIGVLFYVSLLEKQVKIIADRGAETAVPKEEWESVQQKFDAIFKQNDVSIALLSALSETKSVFAKYLPPIENDINELPDNPQVDF